MTDSHSLRLGQVLDVMEDEKKNIVEPSSSTNKKPDNAFRSSAGITLGSSTGGTPPTSTATRGKRRSIVLMSGSKKGSKKGEGPEDSASPDNDSTGETGEDVRRSRSNATDASSLQNLVRSLEEENAKLKERVAELEKINAELMGKR